VAVTVFVLLNTQSKLSVTKPEPVRFLSVWLHDVGSVHRGDKPEGRLLLIGAVNDGAVVTINELGRMQWQH
jgi:hypothetical protein